MLIAEVEEESEARERALEIRESRRSQGHIVLVNPDEQQEFLPILFETEGGYRLPEIKPELLEIVSFPDKRLALPSTPFTKQKALTNKTKDLVGRMILTMYRSYGIGLAAPQIGVPLRLIVTDVQWGQTGHIKPLVLFNPEITSRDGERKEPEGCLSVRGGFHTSVKRAEEVIVSGKDLEWEDVTFAADGLEAACFQHEIDHLNGILFIDKIGKLRKDMYVRKLAKVKRLAKKQAKRLFQQANEQARYEKKIEKAKENSNG